MHIASRFVRWGRRSAAFESFSPLIVPSVAVVSLGMALSSAFGQPPSVGFDFAAPFSMANPRIISLSPERVTASDFRGRFGEQFDVAIVGGTEGNVWGTDVYTDDSSIGAAAVHAGLVEPGQQAVVTVTMVKSPAQHVGSSRHGVNSRDFGTFSSSFILQRKSDAAALGVAGQVAPMTVNASNATQFREQFGTQFRINAVGKTNGSAWGTDVYTDDSDIATAAVHAGLIKSGEQALITVTIVKSPLTFAGSARHGVTTRDFGTYPSGFVLQRLRSSETQTSGGPRVGNSAEAAAARAQLATIERSLASLQSEVRKLRMLLAKLEVAGSSQIDSDNLLVVLETEDAGQAEQVHETLRDLALRRRDDFLRSQQQVALRERQSSNRAAGDTAAADAPKIVNVVPPIGATGVKADLAEISITFDRDMEKGMSWTGGPPLFPPLDQERKARWTDARTCVLPVKLEKATYYRVGINSQSYQDFRSSEGVPARPTALEFVTEGATAETNGRVQAPTIVTITPANGANDVDPATSELRVTFNMPMHDGYSWTGGGSSYPQLAEGQRASWSEDGLTCTLPVVLKPDHDYQLGLNSAKFTNFKNKWGVPLQPVVYKFRTRGADK